MEWVVSLFWRSLVSLTIYLITQYLLNTLLLEVGWALLIFLEVDLQTYQGVQVRCFDVITGLPYEELSSHKYYCI